MSSVLVDSNVLLDVITEDPIWSARSSIVLALVAGSSRLVVNPIIFAEVSVRYSRIEDLDEAIPTTMFEREALPYEAAFLAGKAFVSYRKRGGVRRSSLPDFFIGAHAAVGEYSLLTRDAARYRTYFPNVHLIVP